MINPAFVIILNIKHKLHLTTENKNISFIRERDRILYGFLIFIFLNSMLAFSESANAFRVQPFKLVLLLNVIFSCALMLGILLKMMVLERSRNVKIEVKNEDVFIWQDSIFTSNPKKVKIQNIEFRGQNYFKNDPLWYLISSQRRIRVKNSINRLLGLKCRFYIQNEVGKLLLNDLSNEQIELIKDLIENGDNPKKS